MGLKQALTKPLITRSPLINSQFKTLTTSTETRVLSGIQPTGGLHLGNYYGAIKNWVKLQEGSDSNTKLFYSIVDLHALTIPNYNNYQALEENILELTATLLACGIDPKKVTLFLQSKIPQHTQLLWVLSCLTPFGNLSRMTQFKVKSQAEEEKKKMIGLGLFSYPVLQAADILVYKATHVPVGEDQRQHLELSREIATKFNALVKKNYFDLPKDIYNTGSKIQSLTKPENKMSKSDPNINSCIYFKDEEKVIRSKIKKALTDNEIGISYDPINRKGVSNLIQLLATSTNQEINIIVNKYQSYSMGKFKGEVADAIINEINPFQKEYFKLIQDKQYLKSVLTLGSQKAEEHASITIEEIYQLIGLKI
ncbi:tryptophanyl-tRNA synthetase [Neoconidiobolus thromboides FSU 785]|nr:tryptophanyl-tRNA synthetase [Neoconidiobolus thromboides FSU 785]